MTHRGLFQPQTFCDSVILYIQETTSPSTEESRSHKVTSAV